MTGAAAAVFAEGDEAGERRDRRAQSAYIDGYQQAAVVRREMREQYRARHVAYDLQDAVPTSSGDAPTSAPSPL